MSGSESSKTWSGSVDSYFSESSSSSSSCCRCSAPRRLMSLMVEQVSRLNCHKNNPEEKCEVACMINQDQTIHPQQLAGLLREKLEQLNAESDEDDQLFKRSPRKVAFLEDTPSCSDVETPQTLLAEEMMEVDVTLRSEAARQGLSTSTDAVVGGKDDLGKLILDGQTSIFHINFPELNQLVDSVTNADVNGSEGTEHEEGRTKNGEVRVYENGRVTISFGGNVYELTKSARPAFDQELVRVDQVEGTTSGIMTSLGPVQHYVDVLPQAEDEDNIDEICTCTAINKDKFKAEDGQDETGGEHNEV